jgi:hypothetical protein
LRALTQPFITTIYPFQALFDAALQDCKDKTGNTLIDHPIAKQLETCESVNSTAAQTLGSFLAAFLLLDFIDSAIKLIPGVGNPFGGSIFFLARCASVQWVKKLSQCLAVLERPAWHKLSKLHNNLKIIYVILGYLSF